ncbi:MAG: PorV/PorQ family protein [Bacteroidota bacterium]
MMRTIVFPLLVILGAFSLSAQTENASTGLTFLKLGVGGRAIGMGEAYSALSTDASGVYYNPAGISFGENDEVTLMHKQWVFGTTTEYLGATVHSKDFAFGFGFNSTNVDDIEIRQEPGPAEGTFGLHDLAVSATASWRIDTSFSMGATGKFLYEKIYVNESDGEAFDFGGRYQYNKNFAFAAVITNVGSMSTLLTEPIVLPAGARFGVSFQSTPEDDIAFTVASDLLKTFKDNSTLVDLGGELAYNSFVAFRAGYQFGYYAKGFSAGFGLRYGLVQIDYAYVPFLDQLGDTHTFALTFSL